MRFSRLKGGSKVRRDINTQSSARDHKRKDGEGKGLGRYGDVI